MKMHPSPLLLALILTLQLSAASLLPLHQPSSSKNRLHRRNSTTTQPHEYIEVTRPLLFDSHTPSCTLPDFSYTFGGTTNLPATNITYSPPRDCAWSNAVLQFSASASRSQYDRVAAVWLSGAEILRTSAPGRTHEGIFWNFRKDVTRYASLLRQVNLTLTVMLENVVNDVNTGIYQFNLTFLYYDVSRSIQAANISTPLPLFAPNRKSAATKLNEIYLELNENPADLIIPISTTGDEGFWFKIEGERDEIYQGIQIPLNTYRAVIEVYVSSHGNDEFWYLNPSDYYIEINSLPTGRGHGAYREVLLKLDDNAVGSVIPFPVIFSRGINPLFWKPLVSIGAFNLPSYEIELTPFLGILLDGKVHYFELRVADAISYWLMDANLHLWLDHNSDRVRAGPVKYIDPSTCVERESKFHQLDGKFQLEGERKSEFSGWVQSSAGNFTTHVWSRMEFESRIRFKRSGTYKSVKQEVKVKNKVHIESELGYLILNITVERRYPLRLKSTTLPRVGNDDYSMSVELHHSMKEEKKKNGDFESRLKNRQRSSGWVVVGDGDVLFGEATTFQSYYVKDSYGCYRRRVWVDGGAVHNDTESFLCAAAAAAAAA